MTSVIIINFNKREFKMLQVTNLSTVNSLRIYKYFNIRDFNEVLEEKNKKHRNYSLEIHYRANN